MHQVWIGAQLTAYAPEKARNFLALDKLLIDRPPRPKQDWRQMKATMMLALPGRA